MSDSNDMEETKKMVEHLVEKVKRLEHTVKVLEGKAKDDKVDKGEARKAFQLQEEREHRRELMDMGIGKNKGKDKITNLGSDKNLFILIAGLPGSGKSSSLSLAMNHYKDGVYEQEPIKHIQFQFEGRNFIHMGSLRSQYPGSDSLPRSHQPMKDFLETKVAARQVVVSEGQRLTSLIFLEHISSHYDILMIVIEVDTVTAASRAHLRDGMDKVYKPAFLKQVTGAIRNIKTSMPHNVQLVGGMQSADTVADAIKRIVMDRLT